VLRVRPRAVAAAAGPHDQRTWLGRLAPDITRKIAGAAEAVRGAFATPLAPIAQLLCQRRDRGSAPCPK
jgi:IS5 family transposase